MCLIIDFYSRIISTTFCNVTAVYFRPDSRLFFTCVLIFKTEFEALCQIFVKMIPHAPWTSLLQSEPDKSWHFRHPRRKSHRWDHLLIQYIQKVSWLYFRATAESDASERCLLLPWHAHRSGIASVWTHRTTWPFLLLQNPIFMLPSK